MKQVLDKVPQRFNEGPFWGNASMGALLYTEGTDLRFAVDQVRLWETRDHTGGRMPVSFQKARTMKQPDFARQFGSSFNWKAGPCPTRLPGLTLRLKGAAPVTEFRSETDLAGATTTVAWRHGDGRSREARVWVHAETDVLVVEPLGFSVGEVDVQIEGWDLTLPALAPLAAWGYQPAEQRLAGSTHTASSIAHLLQPFSGDRVAALTAWQSPSLLLCTLSTGPASAANELCSANEELVQPVPEALSEYRETHRASWRRFWDAFQIEVPDPLIQSAVEVELYKLYSNARRDGWPMVLQGVWNHDQAMPAWGGDWHNDLNVQACFWPAFKTNHAELARPYIDYFAACTPHFRERAQKFAGVTDGIAVPTAMAPGGAGAGAEWTFWNSLLGPELYTAIDFCWYYEYTRDQAILRETIVPYLKGVARFYEGVIDRRDDGLLHIPFAHSPEVMEETGLALHDDTTFMVSSLRYVLEKLAEYLDLLRDTDGSARWKAVAADLVRPAVGEHGLQVWPGTDLWYSHRHFCHLFPIFPLAQISRADAEEDKTIQASLDWLSDLGPVEYAAFSFPYRAILSARGGRGAAARLNLYNYILGLQAPNSFCVNGDAFKTGVIMSSEDSAGQPADVFTLEAGLIVPAAVSEMLAHRAGNTVWLLPALPPEWKQGHVNGVTIEGGHRIDLVFADYSLESAKLHPGSDEEVTVVISAAAGAYLVQSGAQDAEVAGAKPFHVTLSRAAGPVEIRRV